MTQDFNPIDELLRQQIEKMTPEERQVFVAMEVSRLVDHVRKQNGRIGKNEAETKTIIDTFTQWKNCHEQLHSRWIGAKDVIVFLTGGGVVTLLLIIFG